MISKLIWKIKRKLEQTRIKLSKNKRPSSYPYISGDSFRSIAHHIFEKENFANPQFIKEKDIVFVESRYLKEFFLKIHPQIVFPYILISHNGDTNIDNSFLHFIDEKIIHWFAQNCLIENKKITPIPIGLENAHIGHAGQIQIFNKLVNNKSIKEPKILSGFNVHTNPTERKHALEILSTLPTVDTIINEPNQEKYLKMLKQYMFIASPAGNGVDCHRTWEALYCDVIPIVTPSPGITYFKNLGLPILIIDSWDELLSCTEQDLTKKYKEITAKKNKEAMWFNYWKQQINELRNEKSY